MYNTANETVWINGYSGDTVLLYFLFNIHTFIKLSGISLQTAALVYSLAVDLLITCHHYGHQWFNMVPSGYQMKSYKINESIYNIGQRQNQIINEKRAKYRNNFLREIQYISRIHRDS